MRVLAAVTAAVLAASPPAQEAAGAPSAAQLREAVDAYFAPLVEVGLFSGAVLIARDGEVLVERAYGLADREAGLENTPTTAFKLMSTSKSVTAVAVMRLVQAGELELTARVGDLLPRWPAVWGEVTVHDLLDHQSSIPNMCPRFWNAEHLRTGLTGLALWRKVADRCSAIKLGGRPGWRFAYSNFNYELLGAIVEAVSERPFRDFVRDEVLTPAGMTQTGFDDGSRREGLARGYFLRGGEPTVGEQDMSTIVAAGGLYSTVGDLHRFDRALHDDTLLDEATRARMYEVRQPGSYALGWSTTPVAGRTCRHHSGGANGYVADLLRFVDDDVCVVVLSNFAFAPILTLSHDVAGIAFGSRHNRPAVPDDADFAQFEGTWPGGGNHVVLRRSGSLLLWFDVWRGHPRVVGRPMIPLTGGVFLSPRGDEVRVVDGALAFGREKLHRLDLAPHAWRICKGAWRGRPALAVEIVEDADGLAMRVGRNPRPFRVVPVTPKLALTLYDDGGGTTLQRVGSTLLWHSPGGVDHELTIR